MVLALSLTLHISSDSLSKIGVMDKIPPTIVSIEKKLTKPS